MDKHSDIVKPVKEEMEAFFASYEEALQGHSPDFQSMIDYVTRSRGKRIRPLILLLSARICGDVNEKSIRYATIMELLHTATIIHDDVVDDTKQRRGIPSLNAKYDNKAAVLLGDYILSIAIMKAVMTQSLTVLAIISNLALNLTEGELNQWAGSEGNTIVDEETYFEIIRKKTAVLLSSCTEIGALSAGADGETVNKFRLLGEYLGVCFQIRDDIFDYFDQGDIGKPTGNDIREGKVTLPLLYALRTAPKEDSDHATKIIREKDFRTENVDRLIEFAKRNGGIEYARQQMEDIKQKAVLVLDDFPDSEGKTAFLHLIDYIINRNK